MIKIVYFLDNNFAYLFGKRLPADGTLTFKFFLLLLMNFHSSNVGSIMMQSMIVSGIRISCWLLDDQNVVSEWLLLLLAGQENCFDLLIFDRVIVETWEWYHLYLVQPVDWAWITYTIFDEPFARTPELFENIRFNAFVIMRFNWIDNNIISTYLLIWINWFCDMGRWALGICGWNMKFKVNIM